MISYPQKYGKEVDARGQLLYLSIVLDIFDRNRIVIFINWEDIIY